MTKQVRRDKKAVIWSSISVKKLLDKTYLPRTREITIKEVRTTQYTEKKYPRWHLNSVFPRILIVA